MMKVKFGNLRIGTCFVNDIGHCVKVDSGVALNNTYWLEGRAFVHLNTCEKVSLLPFRFKV